jgi:mycofactocin precursor
MTDLLADPQAATSTAPVTDETEGHELVEEELLVEDVSIDGMCGVY